VVGRRGGTTGISSSVLDNARTEATQAATVGRADEIGVQRRDDAAPSAHGDDPRRLEGMIDIDGYLILSFIQSVVVIASAWWHCRADGERP
jgi:hypothetical protein